MQVVVMKKAMFFRLLSSCLSIMPRYLTLETPEDSGMLVSMFEAEKAAVVLFAAKNVLMPGKTIKKDLFFKVYG